MFRKIAAFVIMLGAVTVGLAAPASADTNVGDHLCLWSGHSSCANDPAPPSMGIGNDYTLHSQNGRYRAYQHGQTCRLTVEDLSRPAASRVIWSSPNTAGCPTGQFDGPGGVTLQSDGNIVVSRVFFAVSHPVEVLWASGTRTCGTDHSFLRMQNDGNLVQYRFSDGRAVWSWAYGRVAGVGCT